MNFPVEQLVLSHSARSLFRNCTRKFEFSKMYGDSPALREDSFPGAVGTCLHEGFQNFLATRDETKAMTAMLLSYPHDMEYQDSANSARSVEACYATLAAMVNSPVAHAYELVKIRLADGREVGAVEVPFVLVLRNTPLSIPVYFVGFIDAILYNRAENKYIIVDIKTTRQYIGDMSARYEYDEQTLPYGIVLEHILGRQIDQFEVAYLSAFIDLMEPKVALYKYTKTQDHIHDWMRGLNDDILRISKYMNQGWFPRSTNGEACMSFKRPCFFIEYCAFRDQQQITKMLQATPRKGFFHDGKEPWITAELDMKEYT